MPETVAMIDFADIRAVRLECLKCHAAFSLQLGGSLQLPHECPNPSCVNEWADRFGREGTVNAAQNLLNILQQWANLAPEMKRFEFRFEVSPDTRHRTTSSKETE